MHQTVHVELGERSYDVEIGPDLLTQAGTRIAPLLHRPKVAVVTDENVGALHLDALRDGLAAAGVEMTSLTLPRARWMLCRGCSRGRRTDDCL